MRVEKATSYRDPPKAVEDELADYAAEMDYAPSDLEKDHDVPMDEPEDIEMSGDLLEDSEMVTQCWNWMGVSFAPSVSTGTDLVSTRG